MRLLSPARRDSSAATSCFVRRGSGRSSRSRIGPSSNRSSLDHRPDECPGDPLRSDRSRGRAGAERPHRQTCRRHALPCGQRRSGACPPSIRAAISTATRRRSSPVSSTARPITWSLSHPAPSTTAWFRPGVSGIRGVAAPAVRHLEARVRTLRPFLRRAPRAA